MLCRERASGVYGTPAYFTATVLFDLIPMRVLPPCFFAAATYWMVGLRPGLWHLLTFLLLLVLSNMVRTLSRPCLSKLAALTSMQTRQLLYTLLLVQPIRALSHPACNSAAPVVPEHAAVQSVFAHKCICCLMLCCAVLCYAGPDCMGLWHVVLHVVLFV